MGAECEVRKKLGEILDSRDKRNTENLGEIFHYTSLHGLIGILASKSLWLNPVQNLPDFHEVKWGLERFLEWAKKTDISESHLKSFENMIKKGLLVATSSYSKKSNDEQMWYSYADKFNGVVIEFNQKFFSYQDREAIPDDVLKVMFQKVMYDDKEICNLFDRMKGIVNNASGKGKCRYCKKVKYFHFFMDVAMILPAIKHYYFEDESEYRLIAIPGRESEEEPFVFHRNHIVFPENDAKQYRLLYKFDYADINKIYLAKDEDFGNKKYKLIHELKLMTGFKDFEKIEQSSVYSCSSKKFDAPEIKIKDE